MDLLNVAKAVYFHEREPPQVALVFILKYIRMVNLWPPQGGVASRSRVACTVLMVCLMGVVTITDTADLYEASSNIVWFFDDLVMLLGLYLVLLKVWIFRCRENPVQSIVDEFNTLHRQCSRLKEDTSRVHQLQRIFFLGEVFSFIAYSILAFSLFAAISVQPFFTNQPYPIRTKFPFGLHDPLRHPHCCQVIYVLQCLCVLLAVGAVVLLDLVGCCSFGQTALNLKILCIRLRNLGASDGATNVWWDLRGIVRSHQRLIRLMHRINACFYSNYVAQMGASTFIICLNAFGALIVKDQPMVALKFQVYMLGAFMQLFLWCLMGNMVYFDSVEMATAAFQAKWIDQSPAFQRDLMFLMQRAQKPLVFRARPFSGFNFETFTSILSTSYSYFALLRTMND